MAINITVNGDARNDIAKMLSFGGALSGDATSKIVKLKYTESMVSNGFAIIGDLGLMFPSTQSGTGSVVVDLVAEGGAEYTVTATFATWLAKKYGDTTTVTAKS